MYIYICIYYIMMKCAPRCVLVEMQPRSPTTAFMAGLCFLLRIIISSWPVNSSSWVIIIIIIMIASINHYSASSASFRFYIRILSHIIPYQHGVYHGMFHWCGIITILHQLSFPWSKAPGPSPTRCAARSSKPRTDCRRHGETPLEL